MSAKIRKTDAEWRAQLTPLQYNVTRKRGTEPASTGEYANCRDKGTYRCACCAAALFSSEAKFDSGSGWPSFSAPVAPECIRGEEDYSWFTRRTEVLCAACDAHLGHVFDDGPKPAGKRYCINSAALTLERKG